MNARVIQIAITGIFAALAGRDGGNSASRAADVPAGPAPFIKCVQSTDDIGCDLGIATRLDVEFLAPPHTRHFIWVETYLDGRLVPSMTWGRKEWGGLSGRAFRFCRYDPDVVSEVKSKRARWNCDFAQSRAYHWVDDPFKDEITISALNSDAKPIQAGKNYTVATIMAGQDGTAPPDKGYENWARDHCHACTFVKIRFEPIHGEKEAPNERATSIFEGLPDFTK